MVGSEEYNAPELNLDNLAIDQYYEEIEEKAKKEEESNTQ